ncbi:tRNA (guanosine(37)-N1)-methyltransferase TrmD [Desulfoplanes formicivorans]|uniref:tRNA (guanine-N(1)-)-methyltransferase n=1 Tax=Desulfoplanes formicivorans TaxID=1592317 RepID=A0A194AIQ3_9BACT|nr:tRNA (guanosine(37)-N1)-methyltransferase TrmD [Desulfoplanes formicivorans]GAU09967.1 tRNA (guanine-N1)-methyltransferase [Desulfoplanes formicivorans]
MKFNIISIFPQYFSSPLSCGLVSRNIAKGLVSVNVISPRDFSQDKHHNTDDRVYGGGPGMVMMVDPLLRTLRSIPGQPRTLMLSPKGRPLTQDFARELAREPELTLVCGRYEGIDARIEQLHPLEPVSLGDFVLNGGESAAMCLLEAVARLLPGFMQHDESVDEESFTSGLLEYPHYTRPEEYAGLKVPEILRSGDHGKIAAWRRRRSLEATLAFRPEMLSTAPLSRDDVAFLRNQPRVLRGRNLYVALVHYPALNKEGKEVTTSLTNLDVHDIARVSATYGLGGYIVCTPLQDQRVLAGRIINHWSRGGGAGFNPDRKEALNKVTVRDDLDGAIDHVRELTGEIPFVAATSAREGSMPLADLQPVLDKRPVLLVLGTGSGLADSVIDKADGLTRPVRFLSKYNHLSVRSAASIMIDRLLGDVY